MTIDIHGTDPRLKPALDRLMAAYEAQENADAKFGALCCISGASIEAVKLANDACLAAEDEVADAVHALVQQYQANVADDQRAADTASAA